ncbi:MAG: hypothetical protein GPOALKHO_000671 [Sodalis sp.]|nr:MAG: hypothetical protein GPOALKHO_000671 [Sodalis sp.]
MHFKLLAVKITHDIVVRRASSDDSRWSAIVRLAMPECALLLKLCPLATSLSGVNAMRMVP